MPALVLLALDIWLNNINADLKTENTILEMKLHKCEVENEENKNYVEYDVIYINASYGGERRDGIYNYRTNKPGNNDLSESVGD